MACGQTFQKRRELMQFLRRKYCLILTLRAQELFPSIFDVSTMLLWTVLKFMPLYIYIYVGEEKQTEYEDKTLH